MDRMNDKIAQQQFLDFMQIHKRPIINIDTIDWLIGQGFFVKPAAIKHHGNHTGGLFEHSMMVAQVLVEMTQKFDIPWTRPESPYIAVMNHDEKVQCYGYYNDCNGVKWLYVVYKNIVGYASSKYLSK